ncbi:angiotensin-converting enzyme-like [Physella acuta]|uniref:angiotensin-converting enzyme-like n=1 Tax=Physella acuta TaxID=109671 RepID=UPI0027DB71C5|nr:angiotensin-converting enzyme-like [Physella acuta]
MFQSAEEFFTSLGLPAMPESFWKKSMLEKPRDSRNVQCHPSAIDFYNKVDFRIKMCTEITQYNLMIIHHEMGHIHYYMQYKDLPVIFKQEPNPAFGEAAGDVVALFFQTPEHLNKIGLLTKVVPNDTETDINFLMSMALYALPLLPFGYLVDQWRWSVFRGDTKPDKYNKYWWDLRCKLHGLSPPVARNRSDFDPGAKFHIPGSVPYIRYFVGYVIQFQFYRGLCEAAGHSGPLHKCDIYKNKAAGQRFVSMMKLGASKPWPDAMEVMTGQKKMNASSLLEYFQPLMKYLKEKNGADVGWKPECPTPGAS